MAVDIRAGENISADYLAKIGGRVPMLELDDGICLVSLSPLPVTGCDGRGPLAGDTPLRQAQVEMWHRRAG